MNAFDFTLVKQRLESLSEQVAERKVDQIALQAGILAEYLDKCSVAVQDKDIRHLCGEITYSVRAVELYSEVPAVAARHLNQAIEALRGSRMYPKS